MGRLETHLIQFLGHKSRTPNGILTGSAIFTQLTCVPNTQTDRHTHTHRTTGDIRSNTPHLCTVCKPCGLIMSVHTCISRASLFTKFFLPCCTAVATMSVRPSDKPRMIYTAVYWSPALTLSDRLHRNIQITNKTLPDVSILTYIFTASS